MKRYLKHVRPLAGLLALVLGLTMVAPPAIASEVPATAPAQTLSAVAAARAAALPAAALAQAAPAPAAPATGDKPFFKSTKGVVVLVLMAGAITWAGVSRSQDAVHSPGRK